MGKRVVVTGIGVIAPVGRNVDEFWKNILAGKSGISDLDVNEFPNNPFNVHRGGIITDFTPPESMCGFDTTSLGRGTQLALVAVDECLRSANIDLNNTKERTGIALGITMGEVTELSKINKEWFKSFSEPVSTKLCHNYFPHSISSKIAQVFKLGGINLMIPNACSAGNFAIACGYEFVKNGVVDAMVVGGTDPFSYVTFAGFARVGVVSPDVPRPFSKNREGMIPAEGAACLLIEDYESAKRRGAPILAEILGYGMSNDSGHVTQVSEDGLVQAYTEALSRSGIKASDVSYISAHGTGTDLNDRTECQAIKRVFGDDIKKIPISSIKSMIGHAMGAASAIESVVSVLTLRDNVVPPTTNFTEIDPNCEGIDVVPNHARNHDVNIVLEAASGFGGNNCIIIFKKCEKING